MVACPGSFRGSLRPLSGSYGLRFQCAATSFGKHPTTFHLMCFERGCWVNLFAQCPESEVKLWENPYVFPPFNLMGVVLRFLLPFHISFTIVAPLLSPLPVCWSVVRAVSSDYFHLGTKNDLNVILSPSKQGFVPAPCPYKLWVFRVSARD